MRAAHDRVADEGKGVGKSMWMGGSGKVRCMMTCECVQVYPVARLRVNERASVRAFAFVR